MLLIPRGRAVVESFWTTLFPPGSSGPSGNLCNLGVVDFTTRASALLVALVLILFVFVGCAAPAAPRGASADAADRPLVIAHRGASGYLPEHTLAAYALAFGMGADVIEPDLVMTKDGVLICSHDLTAETTTDVASVFPDRARADGKWYYADLTLAEVRRLEKLGRAVRARGHRVPTLEEMVELVQGLSASTGRTVGIIPEPKNPAFHRREGLAIEPALVQALRRHGYENKPVGRAIIQCFDLESLKIMRNELACTLPMVFLVGDMPSDELLREARSVADGLGPRRTLIERDDASPTGLHERAQRLGFVLYPWTFANDRDAMRRFFASYGIAGLFTDYPDVGVEARHMTAQHNAPDRHGGQ
ncbi:MAG: glycerophosphodiester phosphodiesterase family protein [Planctomycetota bacterium]|nr:glycerophosphodiester phosphodiesterase family protein [Planctomycetota bacterium]